MFEALLGALGALAATGIGLLAMVLAGAVIVLLWDWRVTLGAMVVLQVGVCALLVHLRHAPVLVVIGQLVVVILASIMLGLAAASRRYSPSLHQPGNWPLRLIALGLVLAFWWLVDPGFALPRLSQSETDVLLWTFLCGFVILSLTDSPLYSGVGLLLMAILPFALATTLLPGSGLSTLLGVAEILVVLACAYLQLAEPESAPTARRQGWALLSSRLRPAQERTPAGLIAGAGGPASTAPMASPEPRMPGESTREKPA